MAANGKSEGAAGKNTTTVERKSDREFVVTRRFNAPARIVFKAWTTPDLFRQWWLPKSFGMTIVSFEADYRTGGTYRLVMSHPAHEKPMAFFGRYLEVTPPSRLVWTNDEADADKGAVTTVTFEERDGKTLVVLTDLYPSKQALDEAIASDATGAFAEQFEALEALLAAG